MKLTGLKGRIPVEPLDDERLTNIERRIVAGAADAAASGASSPLRAPRFGWAMALAVTAVVAIGFGFAGWQLRGDGSRTVVAAEPVRVNTTGERSMLDIGDARIESDLLTDFTVTRPDGGVLITMKRGKVELLVGKRGNRAPLVVAAGDTRVIVVGTRFSVDYGDGTGDVDVRVTEGVVKVERHQQEVRVAAGQAWTTKRGVIALADLPEKSVQVAIANGKHRGSETVDGATIGAPEKQDDQIEIDTNTPGVLRDRTQTVPDAKLPAVNANNGSANNGSAGKKLGGPEVTRQQASGGPGAGSASMDLHALVRSQAVLAPLDLGVKPTETIALYRKITVDEKGEKAALAMYSIAAQQHLKLGRNGDALSTLDQYVRRFAGTQYKETYHAALWLRVRILCAKTVDDRCRQAAYTYLHQAAGTPAAKVAEALTLSPR
ncbi:MAG: FecR domain-containing protein [Myxococcota bacterium]|nr:FecR domain-containing protein [Myxococcota bacterium]